MDFLAVPILDYNRSLGLFQTIHGLTAKYTRLNTEFQFGVIWSHHYPDSVSFLQC
jgi:hypothetical protein